ncbi:MAG: SURF1 family protein [Propionibacteriaceae bacterium]|nr:SURF1 family protein [Propionibacteriaceae bacterium]
MKKLVLRWVGLFVFVAVLAVLFVNLGEWQLNRLDSRKARNAHVLENQAHEVQPYQQVMNRAIETDDEWLRVSLRGTFDGAHQVLVRYRSYAGQTGSELVTPFQTEQGQWVVVDRGFIARQPGQLDPETLPAPPPGVVDLVGYVRKTEQGKPQATDPVEGKARLINPPALSAALGRDFVDGYVSLIEVTPGQGGGLEAMAPPALDEGPHFWYAVQWFCFTLIALGGFVVLVRADLRDRKKRLARQAAAARAPGDAPEAP